MTLVGYAFGDQPIDLDASVLDANGRPVAGPTLSAAERKAGAAPGFVSIGAELDPGALPPGEYLLVVTARGFSGAEATSSVAFLVPG